MGDLITAELAGVLSEHNIENLTEEDLRAILKDAKEIKRQKIRNLEIEELSNMHFETGYKDIKVALGVPWIAEEFVREFAEHIIGRKLEKNWIIYEKHSGKWYVYKTDYGSQKFGTGKYPAMRILDAILNGKQIRVNDEFGDMSEIDTLEAIEKQKMMIKEFENWVWKDDYRRLKITKAYNDIFGKYAKKEENNIIPTYEGFNEKIELYDYQKSAIKKILSRKNSLIATEVGTGKTYMMIVAAMEMRNKGISKKNMFVVPNNIVFQWKMIFNMLYPDAKILMITPKEFKRECRENFLKLAKDEDFDAIIIAYSCFDRLLVNKDFMVKKLITERAKLSEERKKYYEYDRINLIDKKIMNLSKEINLFNNAEEEGGIGFDDLNITGLFVDEAHNYKNLNYEGVPPDAKGVSSSFSKKCENMLCKVRYVQSIGGRVVFATGTPLSNSIIDTFTMQIYLQFDELYKANLNIFRNWLKTFSKIDYVIEVDATGNRFCISPRIYQFVNMPELSKMFSNIAIFHTNPKDDLPENRHFITNAIDGGRNFAEYMEEIVDRAKMLKLELDNGNFKYLKRDNMLKICTDGRKAALDLRLVNSEQLYDSSSKVWQCVQNAMKIYKNSPNSSQIIFCDYSTPKTQKFNIYDELKQKFIDEGVDESEIAFIHDYTSEDEKNELFEKVNEAKVKILIGSTVKLGVGVNVQTRLKAIHHLDIPWRPSDITQREGRIIRRGNTNEDVMIFRYVVKNSFDAYFWQILEYKQTFITQFLSGSANQRTVSDLETTVLNYGTVKALAIGNPKIKNYTEKVNELKLAKIMHMKNTERYEDIEEELENLKVLRLVYEEELEKIKTTNVELKDVSKEDLKTEIDALCSSFEEENYEIGSAGNVCGFAIKIFGFKNGQEKRIQLMKNDVCFYVELGDKFLGNKVRLMHFFEGFEKQIDVKAEQIKSCDCKTIDLKNELNSIDLSEDLVNNLQDEVRKLQKAILER